MRAGTTHKDIRQLAMRQFVADHQLVCFKCRQPEVVKWAKTGTTQRPQGPYQWAVCVDCVQS
jgi:hypothetical protein